MSPNGIHKEYIRVVAKGHRRIPKEPRVEPDHPVGWGALLLSWKGRLSAVAFITMIVVMGFALHGSIAGRLIEGSVFITSIVLLWMTGTRPEDQPPSERAPGADR